MKKNVNSNSVAVSKLKISTATPLKALGAKAERAACIAETLKKTAQPEPKKRAPKKNNKPKKPIDLSLKVVKQAVAKCFGDTMEIFWEKPDRYSVSNSLVKIYPKEAWTQYEQDLKLWERSDKKGKKPCIIPAYMYVFYNSTWHPDRLGSVAVYCSDAHKLAESVKKNGSFMNIPVRDVRLGMGLRPFVDLQVC